MISKVISTFSVNGFHAWDGAPPTLAYLASRHRHLFVFKVEGRVGHGDREIEFHQLQRAARTALIALFPMSTVHPDEFEFGSRSCEMIAGALLEKLQVWSPGVCAVEVWEDNECGGRVEA